MTRSVSPTTKDSPERTPRKKETPRKNQVILKGIHLNWLYSNCYQKNTNLLCFQSKPKIRARSTASDTNRIPHKAPVLVVSPRKTEQTEPDEPAAFIGTPKDKEGKTKSPPQPSEGTRVKYRLTDDGKRVYHVKALSKPADNDKRTEQEEIDDLWVAAKKYPVHLTLMIHFLVVLCFFVYKLFFTWIGNFLEYGGLLSMNVFVRCCVVFDVDSVGMLWMDWFGNW